MTTRTFAIVAALALASFSAGAKNLPCKDYGQGFVTCPMEMEIHWEKPGWIAWTIHIAALIPALMDLSTTLDFKNHFNDCTKSGLTTTCIQLSEANGILGNHPSDAKIYAYFAVVLTLHTGLWYALPAEFRWLPDAAIVAIEIPFVMWNRQNGARFVLPVLNIPL